MVRPHIRLALGLALVFAAHAPAAEPFRYPEAKSGAGELRYVNGIPVLMVRGDPAEMGTQIGELAIKPAAALFDLSDQFLKARGWENIFPVLLKTAGGLAAQFPPDHLAELDAAAKAASRPRELLIFGNVAADLLKFGGCSTWTVDAAHSATGGPLFGRNMDWPPLGKLHEYCLVTVYRPKGKRPFAVVGYPGMFGAASGMNDAGLALANLQVNAWADGSPRFDPAGVPMLLLERRILEECATVADAEKLMRAAKRTTGFNLAVCDKSGGAAFEITTKQVAVRRSVAGYCACTNHFRSDGLAANKQCGRYAVLTELSAGKGKIGVADVSAALDAVNQGAATMQTMIFEPAAAKIHLAFGAGPSTRLPLHEIDVSKLFGPK